MILESSIDRAALPKVVAVLFADIAGSTQLYDTLGDAQAKRMIDECINLMRSITEQYGGRVVKTIGDEVMCVLPDADSGCLAAMDMQLKISALPMVSGVQRAIRAGFHVGSVIEENNDVFGDTVNLAARMAGLAKGSQIMTTRSSVEVLTALLRSATRPIAAMSVKGKGQDVQVCEVIWQASDEMTMATPSVVAEARQLVLWLKHEGQVHLLERANSGISLGRDATCQIVIADRMASRQHARIERRRDQFFLTDQSSNGTFVAVTGEPEISLRREELMLRGSGKISFGHSVAGTGDEVVEFSVRG
jgi:class 3 adenylate cyclase